MRFTAAFVKLYPSFAESLVTDGMTMSNDLVLREAGLRQVTCIVRERQLRLYGHVARLPAENPAHRILFFEIRGAGPCRGGAHTLRGCVRWNPI